MDELYLSIEKKFCDWKFGMIKENIDQFNQKRKKTFAWQKFITSKIRKKKWQTEIRCFKNISEIKVKSLFYKEHFKIKGKTLNINRKNREKICKDNSHIEDIKLCSVSVMNREMQIKTLMRCCFSPIVLTKMPKLWNSLSIRLWWKICSHIACGNEKLCQS